MQQYRAAPDSQLWVAFDGAAIDRWLTQNDQPLWGHERPSTYVWLAVQTGPQSGTVITAEDTSELKTAIDAAALAARRAGDLAERRGSCSEIIWTMRRSARRSPARLPDIGASVGRRRHAHRHAPATRPAPRAGALDVPVPGSQQRVLRACRRGREPRRRHCMRASSRSAAASAPVDIEVSGVGDLKDYAAVQSYLESLAFISHVSGRRLERRYGAISPDDAGRRRSLAARALLERPLAADRRRRERDSALPAAH